MGFPCFSAIARSVMISATFFFFVPNRLVCFSAIARSVMISALVIREVEHYALMQFQCYSS